MLIQFCRTEFSIGQALLSPKESVLASHEQGYKSILLADDMSINALIPATIAANELDDFTVLCGAKINIVDCPTFEHEKREAKEKKAPPPDEPKRGKPYSFIAVAKNKQGFVDLCELLSVGNERENFYMVPRLDLDHVADTFAKGNIMLLTSDVASVAHRPDAASIMDHLLSCGKPSDMIAAIYPIETPLYDRINKSVLELASRFSLTVASFAPAYYADENQADTKDMLYLVANNVKPDQTYRIRSPFQRNSAILDRLEPMKALVAFGERTETDVDRRGWIVDGQQYLLDRCLYKWEKQPPCLPVLAEDEPAELRKLAKEGLKWRLTSSCFGYTPPTELHKEYVDRLKYELDILERLGFCGYFLVVSDLMRHARKRNIPIGCGRGSVGGSLVAWVMGITEIDPLRFDLLFERFINPERLDLPDADLDFSQARRHEVWEYLVAKYGEEKVAGIVNYARLKSASALQSVARICGMDSNDVAVSKEITAHEKGSGAISLEDAAETLAKVKTFKRHHPEEFEAACQIQGKMRNYGRHAAGIIVANEPIKTRAVMERRKDELVINWDMAHCEDNGLIKLDILGLANLDLMALAGDYIQERHGIELNVYDLPLDDEKTLRNFADGGTTGVFQLESSGMKGVLKALGSGIKPMAFETIVHTTALYRPGPMESGALDTFLDVARGYCESEPIHPLLDELLEDTNGVMIYQEQVMAAVQKLAGFTLAEADLLRRAMGKKKIDLMKTMQADFNKGCLETNGISESQAVALWDKIESFAGYGFNKSHSAAYALISYTIGYLKAHYPAEFFAAALSILPSDKHAALVINAREFGIDLYPPCVNHSSDRLEIATKDGKTILYAPLNVIKGCSDVAAKAIVQARAECGGTFESYEQFDTTVPRRACNKTVRDRLELVGGFYCFDDTKPAPLDPVRRKDQSQWMPDMTIDPVESVRKFEFDATKRAKINKLHDRIEEEIDNGETIVRPYMPNKPKLCIVLDNANKNDAGCGTFSMRNYEDYLHNLMEEVGFTKEQYYVTGINKHEKSVGYSNDQKLAYKTFFDKEMELVDPPVVLAMGREAIEYFSGGKTKASELQGRTQFDPVNKRTVVYGMNPMILYPRPELREDVISILEVAFKAVFGEM